MKNKFILAGALLFSALFLIPAAQATDYTNSIGMKFKNISPGTFFMGSCIDHKTDKKSHQNKKKQKLPAEEFACPAAVEPDKDAHEEEFPQHKVQISKEFQIGVYEVTLGEFKQYLAAIEEEERDKIKTERFNKANNHGDDSAVTAVSWEDTQNFISWLNKKESDTSYRLPTEAEWEYAARAGTKTIYFWGDETDQAPKYAWFNMVDADLLKWFPEGDFGKKENFSHPVGLKKANAWGLYDMAGNVWEWVNDWYSAEYYRDSPEVDPAGPKNGRVRCFRGGSWYGSVKNLRSAFRGLNAPDYRSDSLGFRLVRQQ
ncbi:MAG: formylglycine-generating enzyme family protein [Candidatus Electrothrix sp. AR4]|nr:formylglycine-generating enzyme family protein [Candidatus Electrothrix sp. AR4]